MDKLAENIPYEYAPRNFGQQQRPVQQQRPLSGNMRYNAMGMAPPHPQPPKDRAYPPNTPVHNTSQNTQNTNTSQKAPNTLPDESKPSRSDPLSFLGLNGLDNEKLIFMSLIVILARSGADWVILAALIYIMM